MAYSSVDVPPGFVVVFVVIVGGAAMGLVVRAAVTRLPGSRGGQLSGSATVLTGIVGAGVGSFVAYLVLGQPARPDLLVTALFAVPGTAVTYLIAERTSRPVPPTPAELVAGGESARVEFKATARHNVHTRQRDERVEAAVAKTVAGFLNAEGGSLIIGANDDGEVVGLDADLAYMKQPDTDRYQLWLTDYLTRVLGATVMASVTVAFPEVTGQQVCLLQVRPARRPVFARMSKGADPVLYVRAGNSTRELPVDEAVGYCTDRFSGRGLRWRAR